jgi:membrane protein required for colicin V production
MNFLDWVLLIILAASILYSGWRGFLRDLFSMLGIGAAIVVAATQWESVVDWLVRTTGSHLLSVGLGIGGLLLGTYLLVVFIGRLMWGGARKLGLGWMDRTLGLGLGALKGILIGALLVMLIGALAGERHRLIRDSVLAPHLKEVVKEIKGKIRG